MLQPDFPPKLDSAVSLVDQDGAGSKGDGGGDGDGGDHGGGGMVVIFFVKPNPNWSPSHVRKQEDRV